MTERHKQHYIDMQIKTLSFNIDKMDKIKADAEDKSRDTQERWLQKHRAILAQLMLQRRSYATA